MKKISKMTWIKLLLIVVVIGTIVFLSFKWSVSIDPPKQVKAASYKTE